MDIKLRLAAPSDAASLLEIYRPYVETTTVSFEYKAPTIEEFRRRICEFSAEFPYIVCILDGEIVGYAYAHKYKMRHAYRFAAELSVYIAMHRRGMGIGKRLYAALIELLTEMGYKNLYGIVTGENAASFAFHKAFGFREVGREHHVGYKFGKWLDVVLFEKLIDERCDSDDPTDWCICPKNLHELGGAVDNILNEYRSFCP
ncbi:MAG: N-acetyltransferase [Clostridia bacterium]|nr:N-acetyltransferase [Clostridia bacterium]